MEISDILYTKDTAVINAHDVLSLTPEATLLDAAAYLAEKTIGLAVIFNDQEKLVGVISERDIVRAIGKLGQVALDDEIAAHMTRKVITCAPSDNPFDVINIMSNGGFRHIPVANNGIIIGVLSTRDVFKYITDHTSPQEQAVLWAKFSWL